MLMLSCKKTEPEMPIFGPQEEEKEEQEEKKDDDILLEPKPCSNNVVAHRGGSTEKKCPDNSIAALKYTMSLGCMAMECDILWTKDNNVIVHHGVSDGKVNGLHPSQHTLKEIRNAGVLSNGEQIPTLEEFLDVMMHDKNCCTKLWIETKNITNKDLTSSEQENAIQNGFNRALEIIKEKKADKFVEFNGTGRSAVFKKIYPVARSGGFNMSYAGAVPASTIKNNGWSWANYDVSGKTAAELKTTIDEYQAAGLMLSLYCLDNDATRNAVIPYKDKVKGMLTNYPNALLNAMK